MFRFYQNMVLFIAISLHGVCCLAGLEPIKDPDKKYIYYHATYTAHPDYTQEQVHRWAIKVLDKRAIDNLKKTSVGFSTSVEKIEILEAYNLKADGKRIDSPKNNYQVNTNSGRNKDAPVFSDRSTITTVFPEVEVGDTLVFAYKRIVTEPMFPNYFAESESFSKSVAYEDVSIKMTVPSSFKGLHQTREMSEKITSTNDFVTYEWRWKNDKPMNNSRRDYSVWDLETNPGFAYTTFGTYRAIAEAYGARALPKAAVTDEVRTLANKIVGDETRPEEQARLLYEWVATHITYAGNCVGVGAVVPHDISFILDNHMGDCKDHATLLQALLAAKGIRSIQALINSGSVFTLPTVPAVNSVNHVINYLPDYNLFVDSTSDSTPYGMLPESIQGKPVLLVENFKEGLKTPSPTPDQNSQNMHVSMEIMPDGALKGRMSITLKGEPAVESRRVWRNISKDDEDRWLKDVFSRNGQIGSATMQKDDPHALLDQHSYHMDFDMKEFVLYDSAGAFSIYPPAYSPMSVSDMVSVPDEIDDNDIACGNGSSFEEYIYKFPRDFKILDIPSNKKIEGAHLAYEVSYQLEKNTLTVKRTFSDKTPGPICSAELMRAQKAVLQKISRSLRSQVLYKPTGQGI